MEEHVKYETIGVQRSCAACITLSTIIIASAQLNNIKKYIQAVLSHSSYLQKNKS